MESVGDPFVWCRTAMAVGNGRKPNGTTIAPVMTVIEDTGQTRCRGGTPGPPYPKELPLWFHFEALAK